ncbi:hypothetical protein AVEN_94602-1 [Araneus ventricosus]|uniref:Uncharacterized protein n=1 Tax=Araneus ventricosus TaxID=182803 RepID=A0A4Y2SFR8_ARAVE|nr:hypothetical protein AVEN_94602-1 [Araneus ventricosus]
MTEIQSDEKFPHKLTQTLPLGGSGRWCGLGLILDDDPADTPVNGGARMEPPRQWDVCSVSSVSTNQPRLPKLTLESFSGKDIGSFPSFWARFKSAVHENSSLNDVDKFSYLKSVVTSDAELAIRGLTLTSENYAKAVKILEDRFGRQELIVDYHMNNLLNLTPVRKSFDGTALRNLYDQLEVNIRGLESLGISPDSYRSFVSDNYESYSS